MLVTADRLNDHSIEEETTSGLVAATDFTTSSFAGYKAKGSTTVSVIVTYTSLTTITSSSAGNISDKVCATLPVGWRPPFTVVTSFDRSGVADGSVSIGPDGKCTLKTLAPNATIGDGNNLSFMATWVSGNN